MTKNELMRSKVWQECSGNAEITILIDPEQLQDAKNLDEYSEWDVRPGRYYPKLNRLELQLTLSTL